MLTSKTTTLEIERLAILNENSQHYHRINVIFASFVHYQLERDHGRSRKSMEMKVKLHLAFYLSH